MLDTVSTARNGSLHPLGAPDLVDASGSRGGTRGWAGRAEAQVGRVWIKNAERLGFMDFPRGPFTLAGISLFSTNGARPPLFFLALFFLAGAVEKFPSGSVWTMRARWKWTPQ